MPWVRASVYKPSFLLFVTSEVCPYIPYDIMFTFTMSICNRCILFTLDIETQRLRKVKLPVQGHSACKLLIGLQIEVCEYPSAEV